MAISNQVGSATTPSNASILQADSLLNDEACTKPQKHRGSATHIQHALQLCDRHSARQVLLHCATMRIDRHVCADSPDPPSCICAANLQLSQKMQVHIAAERDECLLSVCHLVPHRLLLADDFGEFVELDLLRVVRIKLRM